MNIVKKTVTPDPYEVFEYNGQWYQTLEQAEIARKADMLTGTVYVVVDIRCRDITDDDLEVYSTREMARRSLSDVTDEDARYYRIVKAPLDLREMDVTDQLLLETHKKLVEKSQRIIDFLEEKNGLVDTEESTE